MSVFQLLNSTPKTSFIGIVSYIEISFLLFFLVQVLADSKFSNSTQLNLEESQNEVLHQLQMRNLAKSHQNYTRARVMRVINFH